MTFIWGWFVRHVWFLTIKAHCLTIVFIVWFYFGEMSSCWFVLQFSRFLFSLSILIWSCESIIVLVMNLFERLKNSFTSVIPRLLLFHLLLQTHQRFFVRNHLGQLSILLFYLLNSHRRHIVLMLQLCHLLNQPNLLILFRLVAWWFIAITLLKGFDLSWSNHLAVTHLAIRIC